MPPLALNRRLSDAELKVKKAIRTSDARRAGPDGPDGASPAQAQNWTVELNAAKADDQSGMELGLGYNLRSGRFRLTPVIGGLIYQGENDRYYMDQMSNGERCRDSQTGHFADKENDDV